MMNQEWYCASTVIAQSTIVIISSFYAVLEMQNWYFIIVAVRLLFCTTIMSASALDKVVTFAGEVLFERKSPTSIKPEATSGERIDLCISSQREAPHTQDDKAEKTIPIPSLIRPVLNSPTMFVDLIKNNAQEQTEDVEYCPVSRNDSEIHAEQNGNLERHDTFKDRGSCAMPKC